MLCQMARSFFASALIRLLVAHLRIWVPPQSTSAAPSHDPPLFWQAGSRPMGNGPGRPGRRDWGAAAAVTVPVGAQMAGGAPVRRGCPTRHGTATWPR